MACIVQEVDAVSHPGNQVLLLQHVLCFKHATAHLPSAQAFLKTCQTLCVAGRSMLHSNMALITPHATTRFNISTNAGDFKLDNALHFQKSPPRLLAQC